MKKQHLISIIAGIALLIIVPTIYTSFKISKLGNPILGGTTKIKLTDTNAVTPAATSTPTASMIPIASSTGKLDTSWINYSFPSLPTAPTTTDINTSTQLFNYYSWQIAGIVSSTELQASADTERITSGSTLVIKRFRVGYRGNLKFYFEYKSANANSTGSISVLRNGYSAFTVSFPGSGGTPTAMTATSTQINVFPGDELTLSATPQGGYETSAKNARVYYSFATSTLGTTAEQD